MTRRAGYAAFARAFEVDVMLVSDLEDRVAFVGFDGLDEVVFGVAEVDFYAGRRC